MGAFTNKIDFEVVIMVNHGNPNGDPLNGNRPREDFDGFGEISDVCLKRKIRNRLQDMGEKIFVQSEERCDDGCKSLADRTKTNDEMQKALKAKDNEAYAKAACKTWIDVRAFGQVFAFKGNSVSVGVRGPVTIQSAFSVDPIDIESIQITKSVNSETSDKRGADTMGMKHRVNFAMYTVKGSINHQLAEKTGFSDEDAEKIPALPAGAVSLPEPDRLRRSGRRHRGRRLAHHRRGRCLRHGRAGRGGDRRVRLPRSQSGVSLLRQ